MRHVGRELVSIDILRACHVSVKTGIPPESRKPLEITIIYDREFSVFEREQWYRLHNLLRVADSDAEVQPPGWNGKEREGKARARLVGDRIAEIVHVGRRCLPHTIDES